ncbi:synaptic vesicle glycoprotein 2C [Hemicordylus capensis]|uniref:synaptic vesicle glycoprotein 2C n=1 Tax=Hemicordylus capensis TaxID=884348 RepID=UPI0023049977|nr:synaptic vesicle glycoprotein 2C [Hemicordylus capensis]XP_053149587.1 synaptic vesicle glycoprotein 2C [Hemicordylus capensis]XP_053149588.1 synaptic vesicle glycoprotein 2C [Hemicordylus capensis]XP_053149589.1 synaptic vesicle glycoprotein 2C [Hemicordylus capensis]
MDRAYEMEDRASLVRGAHDIAKEVKKQAVKKVNKTADKAQDGYTQRSYDRFQAEEENNGEYYTQGGDYDGEANEDEGSSEATEGHDDDDEIYEGEYQGIPNAAQNKDGIAALGHPTQDNFKDRHELETERKADEEELAQQYELIIQECGHGRFQWALFFVLGMALMADGVEVFVVGFVLPSAETDMCIPNSGSGWLGSIVYLGMMVGAFFWGGLADKVGRRQSLLICMSVNGFFAFLSSFVQGYGFFLFCRLLSGFGIGGAVPIVFSYFSEVLAREKRGEHLSWLCMFWMIGGIYASAMAWAIIPHYGWSFSMGSAYQFHSWRVFVVMCALPCVSAVVALTFMPESPRFLLEVGKHDEAWMILKQIHDTNMRARGQPEKVFTVNRIKTPKQIDELIEIESDTGTWYRRCYVRVRTELDGIWSTFMRCFTYPVKDNTTKLAVVWFTLSFGYYGLSVWFPDVIKHLQADEYASRRKIFNDEEVKGIDFNFTLENQIHYNGTFIDDRFTMMKFKVVTFEDTLFKNCVFEDVTTLNTYFRNCTFMETTFFNTDLEPYKYPGSRFMNCTFYHNKTGCQISFDDDYSAYWIYFVNFLGTLAVLPGNIVSALLMDRIGRLTMLGGSMILSGISCFFLWFGTSESMMIGMLCLYNGLTISAWNSLDVITVELYPTDRRATGFGFLNALCKAAAVLGNLIFGSFVVIAKSIPILLASTVLISRLDGQRLQILSAWKVYSGTPTLTMK